MRKAISGVLTAIVTPFTAEGALNLPALRQQVQRQLAAGNGIFCGGTNGEFFVLNEEEKIAIARTCVEEAAGRAPVVAHIGRFPPGRRAGWASRSPASELTRYRPLPRGSCP